MKDITPEKYRCSLGACPKIELDGDKLIITGALAGDTKVLAEWGDVGIKEATIIVDLEMVLDALVPGR